ncbi:MAG: ribosome-associated translation inhibitor RaiA [Armatimonadetes bacterium]|nr:ribosome-associated translation inhibitor RaiA [Armatimonadota bacterium]
MRIDIHGRNTEITQRFRDYVEPRLETLHRHFDRLQTVKIVVSRQRQWRVVEITLDAEGALFRAEERDSNDELGSFDRALDALHRQIEKYKDRLRRYRRRPGMKGLEQQAAEARPEEEEADEEVKIERVKTVPVKPMTAQEAALQMELLGHDFFLFMDAETEKISLVYRRHDGSYGLLVPE